MVQQFHVWYTYTQRTESRDSNEYLRTHIHSLLMIGERRKTAYNPSAGEWRYTRWSIHTVKHNSALQKREALDTCYNLDEMRGCQAK